MRRPPVVLGMAVITALALLVAVGLIIFQVNPQQDETQRGVDRQQRELTKQVREINMIICSQAQTTANAYRFRSLTPSGKVEPIRHFLTRMQAQRQTLELSQGRNCPVAPGFPPFEFQLKRALREIDAILNRFNAKQREPISRNLESKHGDLQGYPNGLQVSPEFGVPDFTNPDGSGEAGVGEDGVPYVPPGGKGNPPNAKPPVMEATPVERQPRASTEPAPVRTEPEDPKGPQSASEPSLGDAVGEVVDGATKELCTAIREVHELC